MIEKYKGITPKVDKDAFVHQLAYVLGDVIIAKNASIWPGASLRGDVDSIEIGENSNVQDNATVHVTAGIPAKIGKNVTIGHNAIVHGATIKDNCLIGMGAIILDGAVIEENCIIAAGALIAGGKVVNRNSLAVGVPFTIKKQLSEADVLSIIDNANEYVHIFKEIEAINVKKQIFIKKIKS